MYNAEASVLYPRIWAQSLESANEE